MVIDVVAGCGLLFLVDVMLRSTYERNCVSLGHFWALNVVELGWMNTRPVDFFSAPSLPRSLWVVSGVATVLLEVVEDVLIAAKNLIMRASGSSATVPPAAAANLVSGQAILARLGDKAAAMSDRSRDTFPEYLLSRAYGSEDAEEDCAIVELAVELAVE